MKKLILTIAIIIVISNFALNIIHRSLSPIPEFTDEMNHQICIEEEIY